MQLVEDWSPSPLSASSGRKRGISTQLCCGPCMKMHKRQSSLGVFLLPYFLSSFGPNKALTPPEIIPNISKWVSNSLLTPLAGNEHDISQVGW